MKDRSVGCKVSGESTRWCVLKYSGAKECQGPSPAGQTLCTEPYRTSHREILLFHSRGITLKELNINSFWILKLDHIRLLLVFWRMQTSLWKQKITLWIMSYWNMLSLLCTRSSQFLIIIFLTLCHVWSSLRKAQVGVRAIVHQGGHLSCKESSRVRASPSHMVP